jgi:hypothetical protein
MSKILQTQLPIAVGDVSPEIFNRLTRILEINLGAVDVNATQQVNDADKLQFNFFTRQHYMEHYFRCVTSI